MIRVRVVVPSWNTRGLLAECLEALRSSEGPRLEVVVVDDASDDGSADMVAERFPEVRLVRQATNSGFTAACNAGLALLDAPYALLLNSDALVEPRTIAALVASLESSTSHGAAAPRLVDPNGATQRSCMAFPRLWTALWFGTPLERWAPESRELRRYFARDLDYALERDVEQPPAACLLLKRAALEAVAESAAAPLDARMRLYFSDVDLSRRLARAGWRTRFVPSASAMHHVGASTSRHPRRLLQWHQDRLAYYRKHHGAAAGLFVKLCVAWSLADFALQQGLSALRGRSREEVAPVLRSFATFLAS
jgi:N-acetylglucosaminyl-diphospho-decaprenol L-rhamnosyltransferase